MATSDHHPIGRSFVDFGPNTLVPGAGLLGRKRGIFVLVTDAITKDIGGGAFRASAMDMWRAAVAVA
jgi:hypothetical protein